MANRPAINALRGPPFDALPLDSRSILCLGLGGGSDAVSACLVAQVLEANGASAVHYGNTRPRFDEHVALISEHIGHLPGPRETASGRNTHGTTQIDRMLPKGPGRSPLLVRLDAEDRAEAGTILAPELDALGYDLIVGVDTGGDVLLQRREHKNRDRILLRVALATRAEVWVVVLGPGCDGSPLDRLLPELQRIQRAQGYLGAFDLAPWAPLLRDLSEGLDERRTPRLLLAALSARERGEEQPMEIPRGARPHVPLSLLCSGLLVEGRALLAPSRQGRGGRTDDP